MFALRNPVLRGRGGEDQQTEGIEEIQGRKSIKINSPHQNDKFSFDSVCVLCMC